MSVSFFDLMKYASTGIASPSMTAYDKMRALAAFGGGKTQTLTGVPPLSFKANGKPLISWSMLGNGQQTGTPTPDAPIMPEFCGKLVNTDWTIPVTCAGQTTPVYLGQTQTVRRIKKLVLDGTENWSFDGNIGRAARYYIKSIGLSGISDLAIIATHYKANRSWSINSCRLYTDSYTKLYLSVDKVLYDTVNKLKQFLRDEYAAGTPVTVWYVLATPETATINEPLAKIGDYADELHSADAGVSIPTVKGQNTLTVDTELQPSSMTITGNIKEM